eukprot:TRINITY_DN34979_c0_g1_i1.p1 TRINITY_DN34979_c0_g1~~TRINITY_DN34979_c0_g1_i1.p1  ORF type:complete len:242 (+),score=20.81 TRINITY_DN34979_c0_g1_i1:84-809(+)
MAVRVAVLVASLGLLSPTLAAEYAVRLHDGSRKERIAILRRKRAAILEELAGLEDRLGQETVYRRPSTADEKPTQTEASVTAATASSPSDRRRLELKPASLLRNGTSCSEDTGGTCRIFNCNGERGATKCVDHKCLCIEGFCAKDGVCIPGPDSCEISSSGTCAFFNCYSGLGPTNCLDRRCACQEGYCAGDGTCYNQRDTGASCRAAACSASLGPTKCSRDQKCVCEKSHYAMNGKCVPW